MRSEGDSADRFRGEVMVAAGLDLDMLGAAGAVAAAASVPALFELEVLAADGWRAVAGRWRPPDGDARAAFEANAIVRPDVRVPVQRGGQSGGGRRSAARLTAADARLERENVERFNAYWWHGIGAWSRRHDARLMAVGRVVRRRGLLAELIGGARCPRCGRPWRECPGRAALLMEEVDPMARQRKSNMIPVSHEVRAQLTAWGEKHLCGAPAEVVVRMLATTLKDADVALAVQRMAGVKPAAQAGSAGASAAAGAGEQCPTAQQPAGGVRAG